MSAKGRLDRSLGAGISQDSESYASGSLPCDPALVEGCVSVFMDIAGEGRYLTPAEDGLELFQETVGLFTERLRPHVGREFNHHAFLDALVTEMERRATPFHAKRADTLFSPVLQALHSLGRYAFYIDLTSLPDDPYRMLTCLEGTEEHPLRLRYRGRRVHHLGEQLAYCSLEASVAMRPDAGRKARHCDMTFKGGVSSAGLDADSCTFHVGSVSSVPERADNCTYYITEGIPDDDVAMWWQGRLGTFSFFERGNTLLVPDPDRPGSWKEVRP